MRACVRESTDVRERGRSARRGREGEKSDHIQRQREIPDRPRGDYVGIIGDPVGNLASMAPLFVREKEKERIATREERAGSARDGNRQPLSIYPLGESLVRRVSLADTRRDYRAECHRDSLRRILYLREGHGIYISGIETILNPRARLLSLSTG